MSISIFAALKNACNVVSIQSQYVTIKTAVEFAVILSELATNICRTAGHLAGTFPSVSTPGLADFAGSCWLLKY